MSCKQNYKELKKENHAFKRDNSLKEQYLDYMFTLLSETDDRETFGKILSYKGGELADDFKKKIFDMLNAEISKMFKDCPEKNRHKYKKQTAKAKTNIFNALSITDEKLVTLLRDNLKYNKKSSKVLQQVLSDIRSDSSSNIEGKITAKEAKRVIELLIGIVGQVSGDKDVKKVTDIVSKMLSESSSDTSKKVLEKYQKDLNDLGLNLDEVKPNRTNLEILLTFWNRNFDKKMNVKAMMDKASGTDGDEYIKKVYSIIRRGLQQQIIDISFQTDTGHAFIERIKAIWNNYSPNDEKNKIDNITNFVELRDLLDSTAKTLEGYFDKQCINQPGFVYGNYALKGSDCVNKAQFLKQLHDIQDNLDEYISTHLNQELRHFNIYVGRQIRSEVSRIYDKITGSSQFSELKKQSMI